MNNGIRFQDVTDGPANTLLFADTIHSASHSWLPIGLGSNPFFFVHHASEGMFCTEAEPNTVTFNTRAPASGHTNGIQVSMVDGSVHWVDNSIDFAVFQAISTRANQETNTNF